MDKKTQLIVALDKPTFKEAEDLVRILSAKVRFFKIGSQLFTACGPQIVEMVRKYKGEVFLDLKFHDIPNTVAQAAISALRIGVYMFNVHALGGQAMLTSLMEVLSEEVKDYKSRPIVLGVTVLTSMDRQQLNGVGILRSVKNEVIHLAKLCRRCGLDGMVCSGKELKLLRRVIGENFILVVPGVRPEGSKEFDQKRIVTPSFARKWGADYIVVGRPITKSSDPLKAAESIQSQIS